MPATAISAESVTVSTSAVGLTLPADIHAKAALITVEDQAVRFWVDGTTPTALLGHEAEDGDVIELVSSDEVLKFSAIRRDGTDATLRVTLLIY